MTTALRAARRDLAEIGAHLMAAEDLLGCIGADGQAWAGLAAHWDGLPADPYAAEAGTHRQRRYGHFVLDEHRTLRPVPSGSFVQPHDSNPLYVGRERRFAPLTPAFAADPVLGRLIRMLACLAGSLDGPKQDRIPGPWSVKVHPFRVIARGGTGNPTPEGMHRDGVTLVSSLLIRRRNAVGGASSVVDDAGDALLRTTLAEPGTLLLGDDRRTAHGVSPIRPANPRESAIRDVLVITVAPAET